MEKLKFLTDPKLYKSALAFVVYLTKTKNEEDLFNQLKSKLNFPYYFGNNWNALNDLLKDFHWIKEKNIVIVHDTIPALNDLSFQIYIQILLDAAQDWRENADHSLEIIFPLQPNNLYNSLLNHKFAWSKD